MRQRQVHIGCAIATSEALAGSGTHEMAREDRLTSSVRHGLSPGEAPAELLHRTVERQPCAATSRASRPRMHSDRHTKHPYIRTKITLHSAVERLVVGLGRP